MGFWAKLFGRKTQGKKQQRVPDRPAAYAPGTKIAFSPELIPQLKSEHHQLFQTFESISQAFGNGNMGATADALRAFRSTIQAHLLTEKIRLYIYLEHSLKHDSHSFELMRSLHHEMDVIGKSLTSFLAKYDALGKNPELSLTFSNDLNEIGTVLSNRIRREETTLYPLYMPPGLRHAVL